MLRKAIAIGVADALAQMAAQQPWLRRLEVNIKIEAQTVEDIPLGAYVAGALQEFLDSAPGRGESTDANLGQFESKEGLDVSWNCMNRYFEHGNLTAMVGADERGNRIDVIGDLAAHVKLPVPMTLAHLPVYGNTINILGVNYALEVFEHLADPDPTKVYRFERNGTTVSCIEVDVPTMSKH